MLKTVEEEGVASEPLWYNSLIIINNKIIYCAKCNSRDNTNVYDIFHPHGNLFRFIICEFYGFHPPFTIFAG